MKISMERPVKIVMLGAGGTGGHIAPHLYRLLYSLDRPVRFIICDGDVVEEKNLVRQNFIPADLGENKAKVLAERYSTVFGMETEYVPDFIESEDRLKKLIEPQIWSRGTYSNQTVSEQVILIGAVDNNRSRQLCHKVFYLIKNGSRSPVILERWVLKIAALEEKKRHYEGILRRELDGLDDEFGDLRLLSQELTIRARGLRAKKNIAKAA